MNEKITPSQECILMIFSSSDTASVKYQNILEIEQRIYNTSIEVLEDIKAGKENLTSKFICYIALFCFGHLSLAEDIIALYPEMGVRIRGMAFVFRKLLPLPQGIGINNRELLKEWLSENKNKLEWNQIEGKYILKSLQSMHS